MDPALRLDDYVSSLKAWLDLPDPRLSRILLIENSGYPLDRLQALARTHNPYGKRFEALSLRCNDFPPELSFGYAELRMLDEGLPLSHLAAECGYWIKATGRLRFDGVSRLLDRLPADYRFAVDSRTAVPFFGTKQLWTHTRLMIVSADFYRTHLRGVRDQMVPKMCLEEMMYHVFAKFDGEPGAIRRWPTHVGVRGVSGTGGHSYDSWQRRGLDITRSMARRLAPNWWI